VPGAAGRGLRGGQDRLARILRHRDDRRDDLLLGLAHADLPAPMPGGEHRVAAAVGERGEVGEQRRDVGDVEYSGAQRLVALEQQVAGQVARAGQSPADPLRGREAVQPVRGGAGGELAQQLARGARPAGQRVARRAAEPAGEPRPVRGELARHRVELAQRAVLGREQAPVGWLAHDCPAPGCHSGSSPETARLAPRERMNSRSESRLR
jgi:hypothetical protein